MPLLSIETNCNKTETLLVNASRSIATALGKPEQYVMVRFQHNPDMLFAGTNDPLAYLELKSIGLPESNTAELSTLLCDLLQNELGIDSDRVYIEFKNAPRELWGWNRATF